MTWSADILSAFFADRMSALQIMLNALDTFRLIGCPCFQKIYSVTEGDGPQGLRVFSKPEN